MHYAKHCNTPPRLLLNWQVRIVPLNDFDIVLMNYAPLRKGTKIVINNFIFCYVQEKHGSQQFRFGSTREDNPNACPVDSDEYR